MWSDLDGPLVADPAHEPRLTKRQSAEAAAYVESLRIVAVLAADGQPAGRRADGYLEESGEIVRVGDVTFAPEAYGRWSRGSRSICVPRGR